MPEQTHNARTRWKIAVAAVAIHLSIGSVYAWSVFVKPLQEMFGWSRPELTATFSIAIVALGLSAAFGGQWMERNGPGKSARLSGLFFGVGIIGAGVSTYFGSIWMLYLTYGAIGGIGLGMGYISPVSTLLKWFPDRRGLATGMAVFGFGAGALITGPVATTLIGAVGVAATFLILGSVYMTAILVASRVLRFPPKDYCPDGWDPNTAKITGFRSGRDYELKEAVATPQFWLLWLLFFINISAGIMLISLASPMAQEIVGLTAVQAGVMVGLMGIFNGAGRLLWSTSSDYIGRVGTYGTMFVIQIVLFALLPNLRSALLFQGAFFLVMTCYGGGFATCPAFIADLFGALRAGAIHGVILTAWSAAGIFGPTLGAMIREATQSYSGALYTISGALVVALVSTLAITYVLRRKVKMRAQVASEAVMVEAVAAE
jgi:MFS transporter, OFA family, oxalate/formate antiporter